MKRVDLAAVKARVEAATDGPWFVERVGDIDDKTASIACIRWRGYVNTASFDGDFATAEFIAAARTDVPDLIAEVERLQKIVAGAEALMADWDAWTGDRDYEWPSSPKERDRLRSILGATS